MKDSENKTGEPVEKEIYYDYSGDLSTSKSKTLFENPIYLFTITIVSIFIAEAIVMFILHLLPTISVIEEALLDALLLVFIVFPVVYFFIFRPLRLHINQRKLAEEKLRSLSLTDDLTGLSNRRGFFTLARQQLKVANRLEKRVSLIYADLDNLKEINDSLGHQEGDKVLIETANILKLNFRESDIIARIGGDEFVVFQIGNSDEAKDKITERFQNAFQAYNATTKLDYELSISFGIAICEPECSYSLDELLAQADKSMYEEKRKKENR